MRGLRLVLSSPPKLVYTTNGLERNQRVLIAKVSNSQGLPRVVAPCTYVHRPLLATFQIQVSLSRECRKEHERPQRTGSVGGLIR